MMGNFISEETRKKIASSNSRPVGSKCKNELGYIIIKTENGWLREHRVIMEKELGRKLIADEVIHHKNGKRDDNRIMNLQVMTRSEHAKLQHLKKAA